ncbi:MAG: nucleotidyltransferase family protein [Patescibacteria group bacterium]
MQVADIQKKITPILRAHGVRRASLFGSHARGEAREDSDIDILVEFPQGKSLLDLIGLERELAQELGKKVDLGTYRSVSPLLQKYIAQDEKPLL